MELDGLRRFVDKTAHIDGWLSFHDAAVCDVILSQQLKSLLHGDILEIGVFAGKSAVLLGQYAQAGEDVHVCDIFDGLTDDRNSDEISKSYPGLSRAAFEENYRAILGSLPVIHHGLSSALPAVLSSNKFRFIHIDGSHLYDHVIGDLVFSSKVLIPDYGVIAVDDFRAQHTVGVAVAVWEMILKGSLIPLVLTPAKIYLGNPNSLVQVENIKRDLEKLEIDCVFEDVLGKRVVRTLGLSDKDLYSSQKGIVRFVPPIAADFLRKSYLWKSLRKR